MGSSFLLFECWTTLHDDSHFPTAVYLEWACDVEGIGGSKSNLVCISYLNRILCSGGFAIRRTGTRGFSPFSLFHHLPHALPSLLIGDVDEVDSCWQAADVE